MKGTHKIKLTSLSDGPNVRSKGKGMSRIVPGFWILNVIVVPVIQKTVEKQVRSSYKIKEDYQKQVIDDRNLQLGESLVVRGGKQLEQPTGICQLMCILMEPQPIFLKNIVIFHFKYVVFISIQLDCYF